MSDLAGIAIVGGAFLGLLAAAEAWSRFGNAPPEWTRKLVHIGGGLICLSLPWMVESAWAVLLLAVGSSSLILGGRKSARIRCLHRVERATLGSEYYPISIFLTFVVSAGQAWIYVAAILVLATADACAALIGMRYGSIRYNVEEDDKSLQGSLAFLAIAFAALLGPMLLLTELPFPIAVLSALLVAALVTGFEAISLHGADNLFVPLGVCVILAKITTKPFSEIVYQNASLLAIAALLTLVVSRVRSINVGGLLVFILFSYGAWSLGSEVWALPAIAGFLVYITAWFVIPATPGTTISVKVRLVFRAVLLPLLLLVCSNMTLSGHGLFGPYAGALTVSLALSLWNHVLERARGLDRRQRMGVALLSGLVATLAVAPVCMLLRPAGAVPWAIAILGMVSAASMVNNRISDPIITTTTAWGAKQLGITAASTAALVLIEVAGCLGPWTG